MKERNFQEAAAERKEKELKAAQEAAAERKEKELKAALEFTAMVHLSWHLIHV